MECLWVPDRLCLLGSKLTCDQRPHFIERSTFNASAVFRSVEYSYGGLKRDCEAGFIACFNLAWLLAGERNDHGQAPAWVGEMGAQKSGLSSFKE